MAERHEAQIRIESRIGDEVFDQTVAGLVYKKSGGWYLRYEEHDEAGGVTRTIVKLAEREWTVKRGGVIESEMVFELDRRRRGYYRTSGIELKVATVMRASRLDIDAGRGIAELEYDLEIGDSPVQYHRITYRLSDS